VNCGGDPANALATPLFKGDVDGDGFRDSADVLPFVSVLLDPDSATTLQRCTADMNSDGINDGRDIAPFITALGI
jgi:hypothetical protein